MILTLEVRGLTPRPKHRGSPSRAWRARIAREARKGLRRATRFDHRHVAVALDVVFYLKIENLRRADLDNLGKAVLDTLFRIDLGRRRRSGPTAALFQIDDRRVVMLNLKKVVVDRPEAEGMTAAIAFDAEFFARQDWETTGPALQ